MKSFLEYLNEDATEKPYVANIDAQTLDNTDYRRVIFTGSKLQLVLMSIKPGEEIGTETHKVGDQFLRIEGGVGKVIIGKEEYDVKAGFGIAIPAGVKHNLKNTGDKNLQLYSLYAPPEHAEDTIEKDKE